MNVNTVLSSSMILPIIGNSFKCSQFCGRVLHIYKVFGDPSGLVCKHTIGIGHSVAEIICCGSTEGASENWRFWQIILGMGFPYRVRRPQLYEQKYMQETQKCLKSIAY